MARPPIRPVPREGASPSAPSATSRPPAHAPAMGRPRAGVGRWPGSPRRPGKRQQARHGDHVAVARPEAGQQDAQEPGGGEPVRSPLVEDDDGAAPNRAKDVLDQKAAGRQVGVKGIEGAEGVAMAVLDEHAELVAGSGRSRDAGGAPRSCCIPSSGTCPSPRGSPRRPFACSALTAGSRCSTATTTRSRWPLLAISSAGRALYVSVGLCALVGEDARAGEGRVWRSPFRPRRCRSTRPRPPGGRHGSPPGGAARTGSDGPSGRGAARGARRGRAW